MKTPAGPLPAAAEKLQKAFDLHKSGAPILIVHESGFWNAATKNK